MMPLIWMVVLICSFMLLMVLVERFLRLLEWLEQQETIKRRKDDPDY